MRVFVWFCATCLWLNISGVPDWLYLCGMYSEFKGFVVGKGANEVRRGMKKWVEEEFWFSGDKKMATMDEMGAT